ncbi:F0F1 ATP synthase subunit epsilon [Fulvimarina endophytica]|uniref:ATP synthase epsilon chain n=1 Tax=Fulvimarina endophytica TaxID=2293836 RepID=A0A371WYJ8_9HYPH|nr:F0F1 ATP synthase subunit epsilon [Fulvimarina endophytica]RFC62060.1 F0F1 ATP synthase subunit epsilon [Fulvimarina endophytica]
MADSFKFELVSPEKLLLSETVDSVVVPGSEGEFTIMGNHAPFMTTLKPGIVTATLSGGQEKTLFVRGGFADINENGVTLLAEFAEPADSIEAKQMQAHLEEAQKRVEEAEDDDTRFKAQEYVSQLEYANSRLPG